MNPRMYRIKTPARTGTVTVHENAAEVRLTLEFSRYGLLGDEAAIARALALVIVRYEHDPRRLRLDAADLGSRAIVAERAGGLAVEIENLRGVEQ